jgi:DNA polymerase III sliding clamp (beta) subunit (PCNA family)
MSHNNANDESEHSTTDNRLTAPPGEKRLVVPTDDSDAVNEIATADEDGILRSWDGCCLVESEYEIEGQPKLVADGSGEQLTDATCQFVAEIKASKLSQWADQLLILVEETAIEVGEHSMHSKVPDPANVALTDVTLPDGAFAEYEAEAGEIGLNIQRLADIIDRFEPDEMLYLGADDRTLTIHNGYTMFELALIDSGSVRTTEEGPKEAVDSRVTIDSESLVNLIESCDAVSDHVSLAHEQDRIIAVAEGDSDRATIVIDGELETASNVELPASKYSIDYLTDFIPALEHAEKVEFGIGKEYPLLFSYQLPHSGSDVNLNLCPRIRYDGGDKDGW